MSTSTRLEEERKHFDDVAEKWDVASIVVNDEIVPQPMVHFKRVIEAQYSPLHELSGKRVLDCGCGVGMSSVYVAKHGAHVTAFDISPKSIEACRRLAAANGVKDRVSAEVADFENLPFETDSFDLVIGKSVLHHVEVRPAAREVYRVLKPGGKAFFWENSDRNPLVRFFHNNARRLGVQQQGTDNERILSASDIETLNDVFHGHCQVHPAPLVLCVLINKHIFKSKLPDVIFRTPDRVLSAAMPFLRKYSMNQIIELSKPAAAQ